MAKVTAQTTSPPTLAAQNRAAAAGRIMMPTAISVPSAWKPPTRFSTTSARKVKCVTALRPLTERRNCGSAHSRTSGRNSSARVSTERLAMEHKRISASSSSASTVPKSTCMRSTLLPRVETISTPTASEIR